MWTKAVRKLIESRAEKKTGLGSGLFVDEGPKMVAAGLASGLEVERVFLTGKVPGEGMYGLMRGQSGTEEVSASEMGSVSHLKTPSAALAIVRIPEYRYDHKTATNKLILAINDVQDPGNMGTVVRIADWYGIRDILCSPATADCYNPKVVQATMGALFRVKVHYLDLGETLGVLAREGSEIYGTYLEGEDIYRAELTPGGVIVMGNEGHGISPLLEPVITRKLFIPSYPPSSQGSESLNVAVATAITCSEFRRRLL